MIELSNLTYGYSRAASPIFEEFDWRVDAGEAWAVLGPSGCGKSTLLYLLAGLRRPTAGTICIHDEVQAGTRPNTGLILQDYGLLPWATARKNVLLGLEIRQFYGPDGKHTPRDHDSAEHEQRADYWINRLNLSPHVDKYPAQLSGGQRQRVAIARTLALNPDLLLMDEPFSSLDAPTRESLQDLVWALRREQSLTTVIVTHAIEEAAVMGERILLLGQPPNRSPHVIDNPHVHQSGYREHTLYFDMVSRLREQMDQLL